MILPTQHCGGSGIERRRRAKPVIAVKDSSLLHSLSPPTFNLTTVGDEDDEDDEDDENDEDNVTSLRAHSFFLLSLFFFSSCTVTPKSRTASRRFFLFGRERTNGEKVRKTR